MKILKTMFTNEKCLRNTKKYYKHGDMNINLKNCYINLIGN